MKTTRQASLFRYRTEIPQILLYEFATKAIFMVIMQIYRWLTGFLLWNLGRPAFTSGDLPYILRSWQGWLLILAGFFALVLYTIFDINAMILIGDKLIHNRPIAFFPLIRESFTRMKNFRSIWGIIVIIYVSLLSPLVGTTFHISLTSNFVIPEFILSVINDHLALRVLYNAILIVLGFAGFIYLFTFHYVILGNMNVRQAMKESRKAMKGNWKNFLKQYLSFLIKCLIVLVVTAVVVYIIPTEILKRIKVDQKVYHAGIIFVTLMAAILLSLASMLFSYFSMMKLTVIYESYTEIDEGEYVIPEKHKMVWQVISAGVVTTAVLIISIILADEFDKVFPKMSEITIIAHRGGGTLANENTVVALEAAIEWNAGAAEIDVQRTLDGNYIINHDNDFMRCCGDPRKPGSMTLEEIKKLEVINAANPFEASTEVATLEEMLDTAKDRINLYIELKGKSANIQMAEDLYSMAAERNMLDQVTFISLNYALINYIETNHPEARTGYLCYFSFGRIEKMNCDILLLEAETATEENVKKIHEVGKEAVVWTVNTLSAMTTFMGSEVDGLITDEVAQAEVVRSVLEERSDEARVLRRFILK